MRSYEERGVWDGVAVGGKKVNCGLLRLDSGQWKHNGR